jgi:hypothetical protein
LGVIVLHWEGDLQNCWGYVICGAGGTVDGWLCHNGKIDSMSEVVLDWFGKLVVKKVKDKMVSIAGGEGSIAWCG